MYASDSPMANPVTRARLLHRDGRNRCQVEARLSNMNSNGH